MSDWFHFPEVARSLNRAFMRTRLFQTQVTLCTALPIAPGRLKPERRFREIARHYFRNVFPKEVARRLPYSESRVEENARNKPLSAQRQQTLWPTRTATSASHAREEQRLATFPATIGNAPIAPIVGFSPRSSPLPDRARG